MPTVRTHYDNLKIARNAPIEVIEAAYRALVKKHHPDRNSSPSATRVMRIVNAAYNVLSDPVKRRLHDEWIRKAEAEPTSVGTWYTRLIARCRDGAYAAVPTKQFRRLFSAVTRRRGLLALGTIICGFVVVQISRQPSIQRTPPPAHMTVESKPTYHF